MLYPIHFSLVIYMSPLWFDFLLKYKKLLVLYFTHTATIMEKAIKERFSRCFSYPIILQVPKTPTEERNNIKMSSRIGIQDKYVCFAEF